MFGGQRWQSTVLSFAIAAAIGCGGAPAPNPDPSYAALVEPGTQPAETQLERAILAQLDHLAAATEATIDGTVVVAGAPYAAASGRECRTVTIQSSAAGASNVDRLACVIDGSWAFVPTVLQAGPAESGGA